MITIVLYVALCTASNQCDDKARNFWMTNNQDELNNAYQECAEQERHWMIVEGYKESDCYAIKQ